MQTIDIKDINNQPHFRIYNKDLKLDNVSRTTSDAWKEEIKARRLWELRHDKDLLNRNSENKKIERRDFENLELVMASVGYICATFIK